MWQNCKSRTLTSPGYRHPIKIVINGVGIDNCKCECELSLSYSRCDLNLYTAGEELYHFTRYVLNNIVESTIFDKVRLTNSVQSKSIHRYSKRYYYLLFRLDPTTHPTQPFLVNVCVCGRCVPSKRACPIAFCSSQIAKQSRPRLGVSYILHIVLWVTVQIYTCGSFIACFAKTRTTFAVVMCGLVHHHINWFRSAQPTHRLAAICARVGWNIWCTDG